MKDNLCTECKRCKGFRYAGKQEVDALALHVKPLLSVAISPEVNKKFRNLVRLRHGVTKGALSFEVERALRQYMGEKDLDVLINDKQWKEVNK